MVLYLISQPNYLFARLNKNHCNVVASLFVFLCYLSMQVKFMSYFENE